MTKINKTQYAILGVLSMKPGSGYDIKKFCDKGISFFWNENFGHIYPVLKKLEEENLISKTVEHNEGRPSKNIYSITPKGQDELAEWLIQPTEHTPERLELLLKLTFARNISPENVILEMERIKEKHIKRIEEFEKIEKEFNSDERTRMDKGYPYWLSTLHYGLYDARFRVQWCEETIQNIREHGKKLN